jgi:hypothetical protein
VIGANKPRDFNPGQGRGRIPPHLPRRPTPCPEPSGSPPSSLSP